MPMGKVWQSYNGTLTRVEKSDHGLSNLMTRYQIHLFFQKDIHHHDVRYYELGIRGGEGIRRTKQAVRG